MVPLIYVVFYAGIALHLSAGFVAIGYLRGIHDDRILRFASRTALLAAGLLLAVFLLRLAEFQRVPLSTAVDSLTLFVIMSTLTALYVSRGERRVLLTIYLPHIGVLCIATSIAAVFGLTQEPKPLAGALLISHVGLVILSFSLFFVASLTSFAYLDQARRLKRHQTLGIYLKLPSLENLDLTLYRLIKLGYPVFAVAMILGMYWAWYENDLLTKNWWLSPKILLSICMGIIYSACFHARRRGWLRGPKLAHFVFIGVGAILGVFVLLRLLDFTNINFYKAS